MMQQIYVSACVYRVLFSLRYNKLFYSDDSLAIHSAMFHNSKKGKMEM